MLLGQDIESELKRMAQIRKESFQLCKPKWKKAIITACEKYSENQNKIGYGNKLEKDIERLDKIISITKSLTEALWDEPILRHWYDDEGLSEALSQISNGSYAASLLCDKAKDKLKSSCKNIQMVSPEKQLYHDLACIYEEACAHKEKRSPDYDRMPSLKEGIFETSFSGQKCYVGEFYSLVATLWKNCLKQPLCRRNKTGEFVDIITRERMDSANFGRKILKGIAEVRKRLRK